MANDMYKHFYELQFFPTSTAKGVLLFRQTTDLLTPPSQKEKEERQSLCLALAFYYTRIFQIYGALALTLIDDVDYMTRMGITSLQLPPKPKQPVNTRRGIAPPGHGAFIAPTRGGNRERKLYNFLGSYLSDDYNEYLGYKVQYATSNTDLYGKIYFMPLETNSDTQKGKFIIEPTGKQRYYLDTRIQVKDSTSYRLSLQPIYYKTGEEKQTKSISGLPVDVEVKKANDSYTVSGESVSIYFTNLFKRIIQTLKAGEGAPKASIVENDNYTIEQLRIKRVYSNLTNDRPQAHCLARAMQLLSTKPITDKDSVSYICKTRFLESNTKSSRSGIPNPGATLDTSPGMSALSQLFYDTIILGTPKIAIGKVSAIKQYNEFMKLMAIRFGDDTQEDGTPRAIESYESGLKGIKNKRDTKECTSESDVFLSSSDATTGVYPIVLELIKIQRAHATECNTILKKLFNITPYAGGIHITLSDYVIKEGFTAIDKITEATRELLIEYYSECEKTYLKGMEFVLNHKKSRSASTPAPSGVSGPQNIIGTLQSKVQVKTK
jgi:hypothetical protein